VTRLDDPTLVRREYSSEAGLRGRAAAYRYSTGPDPRAIALEAVAERRPRRVLDAGCGPGVLAELVQRELGATVTGLDQSERMVELARARAVDAVVGDVQDLPFSDAAFECAIAAWMLYHVPDAPRALSELARVLSPGGRLVAVTNGGDHLRELWELVGIERPPSSFSAENGETLLRERFERVQRRDALGWVEFPDRSAAQEYLDATAVLTAERRELPPLQGPLRVRRATVVFVADKA
jgi:SAM-dependent methyltransferase